MKKLSRVSFLLFINWDNILLFELDKTYECKYVYCCISCPSWFCFLCMNIHAAFDRRTCIIYLSARRNWYDVKPLSVIIVTKFIQWYANYPNDSHVYFFSCVRVDERTFKNKLLRSTYIVFLIKCLNIFNISNIWSFVREGIPRLFNNNSINTTQYSFTRDNSVIINRRC